MLQSFERITVADSGTKEELPFHVILGAGDYTKIKKEGCS